MELPKGALRAALGGAGAARSGAGQQPVRDAHGAWR
jgi:hypothetical protein